MFELINGGIVLTYKIKDKFRFSIFLLSTVLLIAGPMFITASASPNNESKIVIVQEGETLWSIAEDNFDYKKEDIREYIYNIRTVNNLEDSSINIGQRLKLPY